MKKMIQTTIFLQVFSLVFLVVGIFYFLLIQNESPVPKVSSSKYRISCKIATEQSSLPQVELEVNPNEETVISLNKRQSVALLPNFTKDEISLSLKWERSISKNIYKIKIDRITGSFQIWSGDDLNFGKCHKIVPFI